MIVIPTHVIFDAPLFVIPANAGIFFSTKKSYFFLGGSAGTLSGFGASITYNVSCTTTVSRTYTVSGLQITITDRFAKTTGADTESVAAEDTTHSEEDDCSVADDEISSDELEKDELETTEEELATFAEELLATMDEDDVPAIFPASIFFSKASRSSCSCFSSFL